MNLNEEATAAERALIERASTRKTPIYGSIELLPLCNLRCEMCYVRLSREEMERQGRLRTAEEWLALAKQMRDAGTLFLLLTGGEPLLYPELKPLYLELRRLGFVLTLNTNGTLLDEGWADFFAQHPPRRINVTLYGADRETYARLCHDADGFDRTVNAIRMLRARQVPVRISVSLTPQNADQLDRFYAIGRALDAPVQTDTYMVPAKRERSLPFNEQARLSPEDAARGRIRAFRQAMGEEAFLRFAGRKLWETQAILPQEGPNRMHCLAGSCGFTVNWQGELRPCVVMTKPAADAFALGFAEAWRRVRRETEAIVLSEICGACPLRPLCRTCAASALLETGRCDGVPAYMCRYAKESFRQLAQALAEARAGNG